MDVLWCLAQNVHGRVHGIGVGHHRFVHNDANDVSHLRYELRICKKVEVPLVFINADA